MTKYVLYYKPEAIVDLKKYFNEFNYEAAIAGKHEPRLKDGAPLLQNVEGSYIRNSDIRNLTYKTYPNGKPYNEYVWLRDYNGRIRIIREPTK